MRIKTDDNKMSRDDPVLRLTGNTSQVEGPNGETVVTIPGSGGGGGGTSSGLIYNVLDPTYGAKGDGSTDDTAAIQAAIDAASTAATAIGGKARACVVIPGPNKYILSYNFPAAGNGVAAIYKSALIMKSNVDLVGVGRPWLYANQVGLHVTSQIAFNIISGRVDNLASPVAWLNIDNASVKGLVLDGGFVSNQASAGIAFPTQLEDFFGVNFSACTNVQIRDNYITGIYGDSIRLGDVSATDVTVSDNYCTLYNGQAIIGAIVGGLSLITNNICYDNQAVAGGSSESIIIETAAGVSSITGNLVIKAGTLGVLGSNNTVQGNYIACLGGAAGAIEVGSAVDNTITGNVIDALPYGPDLSAGYSAIKISGSTGTTVTGNTVRMSGGTLNGNAGGITTGASPACDKTTIVGNTIISPTACVSGTYDILSASGTTVISGNLCSAMPNSINCIGTGSTVASNVCKGTITVGPDADGPTRILVTGNSCVANTVNGVALNIRSGGNIFDGNYVDCSASVTDQRGVFFGSGHGSANIFKNNIFNIASGINLFGNNGGTYAYGDILEGNVIIGPGAFNVNAAQTFLRSSGGLTALTYGTTVATNTQLGEVFTLAVTNTTGFTMSAPKFGPITTIPVGLKLTYSFTNSSGGTMATPTWNAVFKLDSTGFVPPANGKSKAIEFFYDGTNFRQAGPTTGDI